MHPRHRKALLWPLLAILFAGCGDLRYLAGVGRQLVLRETPSVRWPSEGSDPDGIDLSALPRMGRALAGAGTRGFLVVYRGRVAYEWYAWSAGPNEPQEIAAMAKPIVGSVALMVAVSDGRVDLDAPAHRYIERWALDPARARIRVRDLAWHTSGLDNVSFREGADGELDGWPRRYYEDLAARFRMAVDEVPLLFEPGSEHRYSGIGYYALAYLLGEALRGAPEPDLESLLRARVFEPLGVPDEAWRISYGRSWEVDGMRLHACGSGARLTPRAIARVAELIAQRGRWDGRELIAPRVVERYLGAGESAPVSIEHGWWLNRWGRWDALPPDALVGLGGGDQVVLAIPSLELVMVRVGSDLDARGDGEDDAIVERLFEPLIRAVRIGLDAER